MSFVGAELLVGLRGVGGMYFWFESVHSGD